MNPTLRASLFFIVLLVLSAGCAPMASNVIPLPNPAVERVWSLLHNGEVDRAEETFTQWRQDPTLRNEGLIGGLTVALMRRQQTRMQVLLNQVDPDTSRPDLLLVAANTALTLRDPGAWEPIIERACALSRKSVHIDDTRQICAGWALRQAAPDGIVCEEGCYRSWSMPVGLVGQVPVVMVSVQGRAPVPFIVDTGASTSVLTPEYAASIGLNPVPGTGFTVLSSGGAIDTHYAITDLRFGGLELSSIPVALLKLPVGGVAGIISPQHTLEGHVVSMDFEQMSITIDPAGSVHPAGEDWVKFPMIRRDGNPYLMVKVGDRPVRPMLVDTGASHTRLEERLDALGTRLERSKKTVSLSAGGEVATWLTSASVEARSGRLTWTMREPRIYKPASDGPTRNLGRFGLLGMDMFMGRTMVIDARKRVMYLSRDAKLDAWTEGSARTFLVEGSMVGEQFMVRETLVERRDGQVTLDVEIDRPGLERQFRIDMVDNWKNRGTWMVTRPAKALWDLESGAPVPQGAALAPRYWFAAMVPFQSLGAPTIGMDVITYGSEELVCSRLQMAARIIESDGSERDAEFSYWECAGTPWRATRLELRSPGGELLWGFEAVP